MHKVRFTSETLFDIEAIVLWYELQRIGLSYDFELCLEAGIEEITRNPEIFQKKYKTVKNQIYLPFFLRNSLSF